MNFTSWNLPGASAFTELRHFYDDTNPFEPIPGVYYLTTKLQRIYPLEEEKKKEEEEEGKDLCVRETYASACMQTSFPLKALPGFARTLKADPYTLRAEYPFIVVCNWTGRLIGNFHK